MIRYTTLVLSSMVFSLTQAQDMGLHMGHQMFRVFNSETSLHGISIGLDIPRTGFVTPYGQFTAFIPKNYLEENVGQAFPKDPADQAFNVDARSRVSSYSLELGTMYYFGGAYDYGFSIMMHNSFRILFAPTKRELIDFNPAKYDFFPNNPNFNPSSGTGLVLNTSFGLGAKYTFDWGSLYAIAGLEIFLFGTNPPPYYTNAFSFHTRIGVRRELDFSGNAERKEQREANRRERNSW
jgi:hypothetical protein